MTYYITVEWIYFDEFEETEHTAEMVVHETRSSRKLAMGKKYQFKFSSNRKRV